jgi:hypothetical protein
MYDVVTTDSGNRFHLHLMEPKYVCSKKQGANYCNDKGILGPIFPLDTAASSVQSGDVYFLATYKPFEMQTYEYHESFSSIQKGYAFALFSLKDSSVNDLKTQLQDTTIFS